MWSLVPVFREWLDYSCPKSKYGVWVSDSFDTVVIFQNNILPHDV